MLEPTFVQYQSFGWYQPVTLNHANLQPRVNWLAMMTSKRWVLLIWKKKMQYASLWVSKVWFGRNRHNYLNFSACSGLICFYLLVYLLPSEMFFSIYMEGFANSIPQICATFVLVLHWWPRHVKMLSLGGTSMYIVLVLSMKESCNILLLEFDSLG
jgi:hypothetical protein